MPPTLALTTRRLVDSLRAMSRGGEDVEAKASISIGGGSPARKRGRFLEGPAVEDVDG